MSLSNCWWTELSWLTVTSGKFFTSACCDCYSVMGRLKLTDGALSALWKWIDSVEPTDGTVGINDFRSVVESMLHKHRSKWPECLEWALLSLLKCARRAVPSWSLIAFWPSRDGHHQHLTWSSCNLRPDLSKCTAHCQKWQQQAITLANEWC